MNPSHFIEKLFGLNPGLGASLAQKNLILGSITFIASPLNSMLLYY